MDDVRLHRLGRLRCTKDQFAFVQRFVIEEYAA